MSTLWPLQTFDPKQGFTIVVRKLPHWCQAGTICFITWRTADSIPVAVLRHWHREREDWLRQHGIDPRAGQSKGRFLQLPRPLRADFVRQFSDRWHRHLDSGHGACVLRRADLAQIVAESLLKFDGDRYELTDFIVMPNHVHLLAAFVNEGDMLKQCQSWKHFTAREINRVLSSHGHFWQQDGFDHLVRTLEHFEGFRRYIASNGVKAGLRADEYRHYTKDLAARQ